MSAADVENFPVLVELYGAVKETVELEGDPALVTEFLEEMRKYEKELEDARRYREDLPGEQVFF